jgi:hypothetical protein
MRTVLRSGQRWVTVLRTIGVEVLVLVRERVRLLRLEVKVLEVQVMEVQVFVAWGTEPLGRFSAPRHPHRNCRH